MEEAQVQTVVELVGLLPGNVGVGQGGGGVGRAGDQAAVALTQGIVGAAKHFEGGIILHVVVTRHTIGRSQLQVGKGVGNGLHPGFLSDSPTEGNGGEPGVHIVAQEEGGTVQTDGGRSQVPVLVAVGGTGQPGLQDLVRIAEGAGAGAIAVVAGRNLEDRGGVQGVDVVRREAGSGHRDPLHAGFFHRETGQEVEFVGPLVEVIVEGVLREEVDIQGAEVACLRRGSVLERVNVRIIIGRSETHVETIGSSEGQVRGQDNLEVGVGKGRETLSGALGIGHHALGVVVGAVERAHVLVPDGVAVLVRAVGRGGDGVEVGSTGKTSVAAGEGGRPGVVLHGKEGRRAVEVDEVVAGALRFLIVAGDVVAEGDPGVEFHIKTGAEAQLLHLVLEHDTLIPGVVRRGVLLHPLSAAAHGKLHGSDPSNVPEGFPLPVRGADVLLNPGRGPVLALHGRAAHGLFRNLEIEVVRGGNHIVKLVSVLSALIGLEGVGGLFGVTGLGGDHNDTIRSPGSIDGGGGRILQDFNGLDVTGVDVGKAVGLRETVHDDQRRAACRNGTGASHADGRGHTHLGGDVVDIEAGNTSLQGVGDIGDRKVNQGLTTDLGDRTGEVGLCLGAVTDHHGIVQQRGVHFHHDVDLAPLLHGNLDVIVSDVSENQYRICACNRNGIITVKICAYAVHGSLLHHGHADKRSIVV